MRFNPKAKVDKKQIKYADEVARKALRKITREQKRKRLK